MSSQQSSSATADKGYQGKKNKIHEIDFPFGSDSEPIRQIIYCPYPGDTSYLVAAITIAQYSTNVIVSQLNNNNNNSTTPQDLTITKLNEYPLYQESSVYILPFLVPLKKEKCFLTILTTPYEKQMCKVDIESGTVIWKKSTHSNHIVEDNRGILYGCSSYEGKLELFDSHSGNLLNRINLSSSPQCHGMGFDVNGNLLIASYSKYYTLELIVLDKQGKRIKKMAGFCTTLSCAIDPYKKMTYISSPNNYISRLSSNYDHDLALSNLTNNCCGIFFIDKDCKYLVVCEAKKLIIYD